MCLERVTEKYENPSTMIQDGMKSFSGSGSMLEFETMRLNGSRDVPLDKWITADTSISIKATDSKTYESGFHVYEDPNPKKRIPYSTSQRRVYIRKVTCQGEQDGHKVLIAREMYVPSDPDGWPPKPGEIEKKKESMIDKAKKIIKPGNA